MSLSDNIRDQITFIEKCILDYKKEDKNIFVSSSYQTHSIPLLHILSTIDNSIPVYFLNTGFHFPETLDFKEDISTLLNIQVISLESTMPKINQRDQRGRFFFCSNSNYCCHINKVLPLEPILMSNDIWITGVRKDQSKIRAEMDFEMDGPFDTKRFHPMLNWTSKMIWEYRKAYDLPEHPLEKEGYFSVGCEPCTQKMSLDNRGGRWNGQKKTECGLHTELIKQ